MPTVRQVKSHPPPGSAGAMHSAAEGSGLVPIWRGGEEFETYVGEQVEQMRQISKDIGVM